MARLGFRLRAAPRGANTESSGSSGRVPTACASHCVSADVNGRCVRTLDVSCVATRFTSTVPAFSVMSRPLT